MNLSLLKPQDWDAFSKRYPSADAFLLNQSLYRERIALRIELASFKTGIGFYAGRKIWIEARLSELDTLTFLQDYSVNKEQ